jgi:hypothetical protein
MNPPTQAIPLRIACSFARPDSAARDCRRSRTALTPPLARPEAYVSHQLCGKVDRMPLQVRFSHQMCREVDGMRPQVHVIHQTCANAGIHSTYIGLLAHRALDPPPSSCGGARFPTLAAMSLSCSRIALWSPPPSSSLAEEERLRSLLLRAAARDSRRSQLYLSLCQGSRVALDEPARGTLAARASVGRAVHERLSPNRCTAPWTRLAFAAVDR